MMKSSSLPTSDGDESETELEQLCGSVVHIIDCLFKESSRVRNAARHSHLTEEQPIDVSAFEQHDRDHVRDKYLEADKVLVHGFGNASTRRRKILAYRERHRAKLSIEIGSVQNSSSKEHASQPADILTTDLQ